MSEDNVEVVDADEVLDPGMPGLIDFPARGRGHVVDAEEAWNSPCLCRELKDGGTLCFSKGVVGPLDGEQRALYCSAGEEPLRLTPDQEARLQRFATAAHHCHDEVAEIPKGEELEPYLACMRQQLKHDASVG